MTLIVKVRPFGVTEVFQPGDESWGPCELCGGPTLDDQCAGDCCLGPAETALCLACGHYSPLVGVVTFSWGPARQWPRKSCPCPVCQTREGARPRTEPPVVSP